jgi:hypothetical protein
MRNGSTINDSDDQRDGQKCVESTVVEEGMMMLISAHLLPNRHLLAVRDVVSLETLIS